MNIAIIGTGAYGLALATMFHENKNNITMWSKFETESNKLKTTNEFKGNKLPTSLNYTTDMQECIKNSNLIFRFGLRYPLNPGNPPQSASTNQRKSSRSWGFGCHRIIHAGMLRRRLLGRCQARYLQ